MTYLLEDSRREPIAGRLYEYELHCSVANPDVHLVESVAQERNEVYVKWLGFDNSWIHKDNVL